MVCQLGHAKINNGRIWVPNEVQSTLGAVDGDTLLFSKKGDDVVVTKNERCAT